MSMFLSSQMDELGTVEAGDPPTSPAYEAETRRVRRPASPPSPSCDQVTIYKATSGPGVDQSGPLGAETEGFKSSPSTVEWRDAVIALLPSLRAFAWSLSRNSADADDLVQDTLIKAWTHHDKFEPGTNLRAWLFTILRNTYYTAVVRRRREVADEDGKHAARLSAAPTQEWSVAMKAMQAALQRLPSEQREALILIGAAGVTYEEAAEICGCALGTIKSRVNRARARLLQIMDADDATDALVASIDAPEAHD